MHISLFNNVFYEKGSAEGKQVANMVSHLLVIN